MRFVFSYFVFIGANALKFDEKSSGISVFFIFENKEKKVLNLKKESLSMTITS